MSLINLNDAIPAAPAHVSNIKWQADEGVAPRNVSAYMPLMVGDDDPTSPTEAPESGAVPAPAPGDAAAGKYLKADGTWEIPPGGGGSGTVREVPAGTLDGANATFTLSYAPVPAGSLILTLNGVIQNPGSGSPISGEDYTISGPTITYDIPPQSGDEQTAWYSH